MRTKNRDTLNMPKTRLLEEFFSPPEEEISTPEIENEEIRIQWLSHIHAKY